MSHTSQRRGLGPGHEGKEMIVLAMLPARAKDRPGAGAAMSELALKMMDHHPHNWLIRNFSQTIIPDLGPAQSPLKWARERWPDKTERLVMRAAGHLSSVVTAAYTDLADVKALLADLKGPWLAENRKRALPISIVLSGRFDDARECGRAVGATEHTSLFTLGFFGKVKDLPSETELEIVTMCGHGLIAVSRVRDLAERVRLGAMTAREAAAAVGAPCVCGIVNMERAEEIFTRLAKEG